MNARMLLPAVLILVGATSGAVAQSAVRLLRTARIEPGCALLLGDIAEISGPDAASLGGLVFSADPASEPQSTDGWIGVEIEAVRERLKAELGLNAGMIALSGSRCDVRVVTPVERTSDQARPAPPPGPVDAQTLVDLDTVRGAIVRELVRLLRTLPQDLRLEFETGDASTLDTPLVGRVVEIAAVGSSDRMPFAVTLHEASGKSLRRSVRVGVLVRRQVALAQRAVERGDALSPEDVTVEERWLRPGDTTLDGGQVVGAVARRRLKPGDVLNAQLIEPPVLIHRGDRLQVRVMVGGVVIRRWANALEDGCEGDEISFAATSDSRQRFAAVVVGRGDALVWPQGAARPGTELASSEEPAP